MVRYDGVSERQATAPCDDAGVSIVRDRAVDQQDGVTLHRPELLRVGDARRDVVVPGKSAWNIRTLPPPLMVTPSPAGPSIVTELWMRMVESNDCLTGEAGIEANGLVPGAELERPA